MGRKTPTRLLQKLQRDGRVKCIVLNLPGRTNGGRSRKGEVVLLPEVQVGPDLRAKGHDRIPQLDRVNRGYGSSKVKADASTVPVLSVKQTHKGGKRKFDAAAATEAENLVRTLSERLYLDGFVPAKMARVQMLHIFLWSYINGTSEHADDKLVMKPGKNFSQVCTKEVEQ